MLHLLLLLRVTAGIHGAVRSSDKDLPVPGAVVEVDGLQAGVTDSLGRYRLGGLPAGSHEICFVAPGYDRQRVTVTLVDQSDLALDINLVIHPVLLPPIEAVAQRLPAPDRPVLPDQVAEPGLSRFGTGWQGDRPATAVDVHALLATSPDVATRSDNLSSLSVRGGRGSENRTLLDGIPIGSATHFAGAASAINPDVVAGIDLHSGVSSVQFDGALSGVVELHTATDSPAAIHVVTNASVHDIRSLIRMPIGRSSLMLGARTSYRDLLTDGSAFGITNGYQDALAIGRFPVGSGELSVVSFEGGNRMHWEPSSAGLDVPGQEVAAVAPPTTRGNSADWRSGALGATWTRSSPAGAEWRFTGWWNGSSAAIQKTSEAGASHALSSGLSELGVSADHRLRLGVGSLLLGAELTRPKSWYRLHSLSGEAGGTLTSLELTGQPTLAALFGEWSWRATTTFDVRLGLRGNTDFAGHTSLAPRIVLGFHPDAQTTIGAGFGRTHQTVQSFLNEENLASAIVSPMLPVATAAAAPVARADQYALSFSRQLGRRTALSLDGYVRVWHDVVTPAASSTGFFATVEPRLGDGQSRGVNASFTTTLGALAFRATAGLASATQQVADGAYHIGSEQPWLVLGDIGWHPGRSTAVQLAWTTGGGQPATALLPGLEWRPFSSATGAGEMEGVATNQSGPVNGLRLPGRLRLDAGIRHLWSLGSSRSGGITTSLRLENLLNRSESAGVMATANGTLQLLRGTPRGVVFELGWVY